MTLTVAGLFAGIGGLELGMTAGGHRTALLVENNPVAAHVLRRRFPDTPIESDVRDVDALPRGTDLLVAGFPCQDLSSVGRKAGITGARSSLVGEALRLARRSDVPWLVLENVPFLMSLNGGAALRLVTESLTALGYRWAYRVVDTNAFGLPQRRNRWYLVASRDGDPRDVLLADDAERPEAIATYPDVACGFYWTEGTRSFGWAVDAVPPIKCGSSVGVASPPAIRLPSGEYVTPDIRDAERLQGFPSDWTAPADEVAKGGERWRMVGNSVSVPVAAWIGRRLDEPGRYDAADDEPWAGPRWPRKAAWADTDGVVYGADVGPWPQWADRVPLEHFLQHPGKPLSGRAATGFISRTHKGSLRFPPGFVDELTDYAAAR
ncbi:DNA cytosine methyltransferase [Mycolicibacterium sediminis]|uniref:Cytosine-specific methyltransferase n=1 Tax=Mycolicibacterium sediminis TaxID=1286180 RepID=A0A7I7QP85_9MYCO|nr:DNA (cytosine-5-)-methyltransferase [Mycolicibacterium sediminis]BBY28183.1 putative BsuMI modification methylase subunit YdiP [Mycolicibacterium sediminis]